MSLNLYYQQYLMIFLLCFMRNLSLVNFFYVTRQLAMTLKTILALVLAAMTYFFNPVILISWSHFWVLGLENMLLGFIISFLLSLPFYLMEMSGSLVDNYRGETVAATFSHSFIDRQSSFFNLLGISFLTYFITCNGLFLFIKIIFLSYRVLPLTQGLPSPIFGGIIAIFEHLMTWFALITFPATALTLLVDIIFAFSAVVVPNLNTFFLGFPLKSMAIILLYFFLIPTLFMYMMGYFKVIVGQLGF